MGRLAAALCISIERERERARERERVREMWDYITARVDISVEPKEAPCGHREQLVRR